MTQLSEPPIPGLSFHEPMKRAYERTDYDDMTTSHDSEGCGHVDRGAIRG